MLFRQQVTLNIDIDVVPTKESFDKTWRLIHFVRIYFPEYLEWLNTDVDGPCYFWLTEIHQKIYELCRKWVSKWSLSELLYGLYILSSEERIAKYIYLKQLYTHCYRILYYSLEERFKPATVVHLPEINLIDICGNIVSEGYEIKDEDIPF